MIRTVTAYLIAKFDDTGQLLSVGIYSEATPTVTGRNCNYATLFTATAKDFGSVQKQLVDIYKRFYSELSKRFPVSL